LVTGGNGFIGSNFIEYVDSNFKDVKIYNSDKMGVGSRSLDHLLKITPGSQNDIGKFYVMHLQETHNGNTYYATTSLGLKINGNYGFDIRGRERPKTIDYVFHFAAESHVDRSITGPRGFIDNNVTATSDLLEFIRTEYKDAIVICISTDEVYGHLHENDPPFTEDSHLNPRSPYSASKAASDLVALSYFHTFGLDVRVTRCCNNYGPHQADEKLIPTVLRKLFNNEKIPVYGTGMNIREWIHVDDHNKAVLEIADVGEPGGVYNIGSGLELTNLELIGEILEIVDPENELGLPVEFVEDRKGHDFRYAIDSVRWTNNLDQIPFKEGLKQTVDFYRKKYEI
jgi:dTDP-glucose 4,6-dehydratase